MKRVISLGLALIICLSLCACGNSQQQMSDKFSDLTARMVEMNRQCDILTPGVMEIWNNVGGDRFWGVFERVLKFTSEDAFEVIRNNVPEDTHYTPDQYEWMIGMIVGDGFDPDFEKNNNSPLTESRKAFILENAMPLAVAYDTLAKNLNTLQEEVSQFIKDYKGKYPAEADLLKEWMLETLSYAEHAMSPSGTYADYQKQCTEYQRNVSRFMDEAKMLK